MIVGVIYQPPGGVCDLFLLTAREPPRALAAYAEDLTHCSMGCFAKVFALADG